MTDIQTAFITSHEKEEFDKICTQLRESARDHDTYVQIMILLSKYNHEDSEVLKTQATEEKSSCGEICDDEEDTTITECYERVVSLFPDNTIRIAKFNAFGRSIHGKSTSKELHKFVLKIVGTGAKNVNTEINMHWAVDDLEAKQQYSLFKNFLGHHIRQLKMPTTHSESRSNMKIFKCFSYTKFA